MKSALFLCIALGVAAVRAAPVPRTQNIRDDKLAVRYCALVRRGDVGPSQQDLYPRAKTERQKAIQKVYYKKYYDAQTDQQRAERNKNVRIRRAKKSPEERKDFNARRRIVDQKRRQDRLASAAGSSTPDAAQEDNRNAEPRADRQEKNKSPLTDPAGSSTLQAALAVVDHAGAAEDAPPANEKRNARRRALHKARGPAKVAADKVRRRNARQKKKTTPGSSTAHAAPTFQHNNIDDSDPLRQGDVGPSQQDSRREKQRGYYKKWFDKLTPEEKTDMYKQMSIRRREKTPAQKRVLNESRRIVDQKRRQNKLASDAGSSLPLAASAPQDNTIDHLNPQDTEPPEPMSAAEPARNKIDLNLPPGYDFDLNLSPV